MSDQSSHPGLFASVIVPTFNRRQSLYQMLLALDLQHTETSSGTPFSFEVIVVSDGSTDGTDQMLAQFPGRFPLRVIRQENAGPAAARNAGVLSADGEIIVFIDDDVMAEPGCLAAHVSLHEKDPTLVVVGPMLTPGDADLSPWIRWEQHQLEKQYCRLSNGEILGSRQFYTGNASARRQALIDAGLFDTTLLRAEDIDLGQRLAAIGQRFEFAPNAEAYHYASRSFESWSRVAYDYGYNDVVFANDGNENSRSDIRRFFDERSALQRTFYKTLAPDPERAEATMSVLTKAAATAELARAHRVNRGFLSALYGMHYYRGVIDSLGSSDAFLDLVGSEEQPAPKTNHFVPWFVLEQTLGHITHSKNLRTLVPTVPDVEPIFIGVDFDFDQRLATVPVWSNWTVRAGMRARRQLRDRWRNRSTPRPDALFVHTQVAAVLLGEWMDRIPTVVSLDATPKQYDSLGEFYDHEVGSGRIEEMKDDLNRRCYEKARHVTVWSQWAKDGLIDEYNVDPDKITVISPGVNVDLWRRPDDLERGVGPTQILFVGGDFERKGGLDLLEANRRLQGDPTVGPFELHLVTKDERIAGPGVVVHNGLTGNSPELIDRYHRAEIFCLPTYGDCLPMVLAEAGAASLPIVSTDVGGIASIVRPGETGILCKPGDVEGLTEALRSLLVDEQLRSELGSAARRHIEQHHDAAQNAAQIIDILRSVSA